MSETENKDQPFEDIRALIASMPNLDPSTETTVSKNAISLGRGLRPIGRLEAPLALISDWQGTPLPSLLRPLIAVFACLLYTSPSPRDRQKSRMPSSA